MPFRQSVNFARMLRAYNRFRSRAPRFIGTVAVKHFKQSWRRQAWLNDSGRRERWKPRQRRRGDRSRRGTLVKTGRLRRSIRITSVSSHQVRVGTSVHYARIHNEGGRIRATQSVDSHRRRAHTRLQRGKRVKVSETTVSAHSRRIDIDMPQRQFMGRSRFLERRITKNLEHRLHQIFKNA